MGRINSIKTTHPRYAASIKGRCLVFLFGAVCFIGCFLTVVARASHPSINTLQIMWRTTNQLSHLSRFKPADIVCLWWRTGLHGVEPYVTPAYDEYQPDLLVVVTHGKGQNPWSEMRLLEPALFKAGDSAAKPFFHAPLGDGRQQRTRHNVSYYTKTVAVMGHPLASLAHLNPLWLRFDTTPFVMYYHSRMDGVASRSGVAEALRPDTYALTHPVGNPLLNHWGYAFPRTFTVQASSDYKASLLAALHGADIATNHHALHLANGTNNRCGHACAVKNVIEEQDSQHPHAIWQEIYPNNRVVTLGEDDSQQVQPLGKADALKGEGNYIFSVWRHYRGCKQGQHFVKAVPFVPPTQKR